MTAMRVDGHFNAASFPRAAAPSPAHGRGSTTPGDEPWWYGDVEWCRDHEIPAVLGYLEGLPDYSLAPLRVLELGSGTGLAALPLASGGHSVLATDPRQDLLRALEHRLAAQGDARARVSTRRMDMSAFMLNESFKAVCILGASVMLLSPAQRRASFECARLHLPPGGALIVSTCHALPQTPSRSSTVMPSGVPIIHEIDHSAGRMTTIMRRGQQSIAQDRHLVTPADLVHDMRAMGLALAGQNSAPVPNQPLRIWSIVAAINRG